MGTNSGVRSSHSAPLILSNWLSPPTLEHLQGMTCMYFRHADYFISKPQKAAFFGSFCDSFGRN